MSRDFRRRGLRGNTVAVSFDGESLTVSGDTFGRIDIALARLRRMRIGLAQTRSATFHQLLIWPAEAGKPLLVGTSEPNELPRYAALVRAVCEAVARGGHPARLEVGESKAWAAFMLVLFGLQAAGFAAIASYVLGESEEALGAPHAIAIAVPIVFLAGALAAMWWAWRRQWPRVLRRSADLDRVLPRVR